jgi:hypothetical protein
MQGKKRVRSLFLAGYTESEINKVCVFSPDNLESELIVKNFIARTIYNIKPTEKNIHYGSKQEAYFDPDEFSEDDLINLKLTYTYEDLSESEKEIYNSKNEEA